MALEDPENYFNRFRKNIIGIDSTFISPYGEQKIIYADWIASGRLYAPIEHRISYEIGPMIGNTHSESSQTGKSMTIAYHKAQKIIKKHVNASDKDVLLSSGFGMTSALAKFQRILGLKVPEKLMPYCKIPENERPVVFISHMEHHSNHTPWLESLVDVVVLEPDENLFIDPGHLREAIKKYAGRSVKIGSFSACSNVTGIITPYHELAEIMHENGGYCFVDFAASAPYVKIDMHPQNEAQRLDAIFFSPHKFLGGPGSAGVLIFNKELYKNRIPDHPGGGTVSWTNPWGGHAYFDDIEIREDGGTPGFLQTIKTALCIKLKEEMDVEEIHQREDEQIQLVLKHLRDIHGLHILADNPLERIGVFSFYVEGIHHNLVVKLLNDRFGIQVRGGCSCAGTYGHFLLHVDQEMSKRITEKINKGDLSEKPGWVRLSVHPTMTDHEILFICQAIRDIIENIGAWAKDYKYSSHTNEFYHISDVDNNQNPIIKWFD